MKFSAAFALFAELFVAIRAAVGPTCRGILSSPSLLWHPMALRRLMMAHVWNLFGDLVDEGGRSVKQRLVTRYAYGVVLDIGAGHGHTVNYLDKTRVTKYIALEPNTLMHPKIRAMANAAGFDEVAGTLFILGCGAEDTTAILSGFGDEQQQVDTIISILTLCSVPSPQRSLRSLVNRVLKSGGQFLFYEHVLSDRPDVAWWQRLWSPLWGVVFDGCRLDRPTHRWFQEMGMDYSANGEGVWKDGEVWPREGEPEEHLFYHIVGKFEKA